MPPCVYHAASWPPLQLMAVRLEAHAMLLLMYTSWSTSSPRACLK